MRAGVDQCLLEAPGAFRSDDDGLSVFEPHGPWTEAKLRKAEAACPMAAIIVTGQPGQQAC